MPRNILRGLFVFFDLNEFAGQPNLAKNFTGMISATYVLNFSQTHLRSVENDRAFRLKSPFVSIYAETSSADSYHC